MLGLLFGWTWSWVLPWAIVVGAVVGAADAMGFALLGGAFHWGPVHIVGGQAFSLFTLFLGFVGGAAIGFLGVGSWLFVAHLYQVIVAMVVGAIVTLVLVFAAVAMESVGLRLRGYRRLSQDEIRRIEPLVDSLAGPLELGAGRPRFAMADIVLPNAWTHTRTIVLTTGLLRTLSNDEELTAILAHELAHWRCGDAVATRVVWACSLPIVLMLNLGSLLSGQRQPWMSTFSPSGAGQVPSPEQIIQAVGTLAREIRGLLRFIGWVILWPAVLIQRLVITPVLRAGMRRSEFWADTAAAHAGLGEELMRALPKLSAWEGGRTGWEATLARTHPPTALRIEKLQVGLKDDQKYQEPELSAAADVRNLVGRLLRGPAIGSHATARVHDYGQS